MPAMTVQELQQFLEDAFPGTPVDAVVEEVSERGVSIRVPIGAAHERPGGTVFGPAMMAAADLAAYLSILAQIGPVALAVTTSLHIDLLRKPVLEDLLAEGRLLKLGTRLAVVQVLLRPVAGGEAVASAQVTYSIPPH